LCYGSGIARIARIERDDENEGRRAIEMPIDPADARGL
jgi:hypothetical protein